MSPRLLPNSLGGCCVFSLVQLRNPLSFAVSAPAIGCGNSLEGNITRISTSAAMSHRPYFQGGRRGGSGGSSGGRGGGRGAVRVRVGGQRWWDPAWRAERLHQKAAEINMSMETETRFGNLLNTSNGTTSMGINSSTSADTATVLAKTVEIGRQAPMLKSRPA